MRRVSAGEERRLQADRDETEQGASLDHIIGALLIGCDAREMRMPSHRETGCLLFGMKAEDREIGVHRVDACFE
jgi:hypothetical protein